MNANRSKYTTTPTYGIQKRNIFEKKSMFPHAGHNQPDFSSIPNQAEMSNPALFSMPQQNNPFGATANPGAGFSSTPTSPMPDFLSAGGVNGFATSATPAALGYNTGVPAPYNMQQPGYADPAQMAAPQSVNPPPLAASASQFNSRSFNPLVQGFVPPQPQQQTAAAPEVQPAGFEPFPPQGGAGFFQQNTASFPPVQAQNTASFPPVQGQNTASFPPVQPQNPAAFQQPGNSGFMQMAAQSQAAQPRYAIPPADPNLIWLFFILGLIPILFIPCVFVSQSMNVVRYIFLVSCIIGIGILWYKQLLNTAGRIAITVLYIAMFIFTLVRLSDGTTHLDQGMAPSSTVPLASYQFTPNPGAQNPDYDYAAQAGLAQPVTDAPTPTPAAKSEAETRLEIFMNNWCRNSIEDMVPLVMPSWANNQESPVTALFTLLTNRLPISYQIEDITGTEDDTSRTITMRAEIDKQNGKAPVLYRFMVLMVKEGGQWYVNPNSLATNDQLPQEEVVVNDKNSTNESVTAAPRTTVSPAPPADTMLYYNPDGGHYYHMDANCESIKEEFRPLTGTFSYRDLRQYINTLSPCLRCGAPTSALPEE